MKIKQYDVWLADLNLRLGTEPGKKRPVVIIQTDLLNDIHPSTIVCPLTSQVNLDIDILRVHLHSEQVDKPSDVLVDQIRTIHNSRLIKKIGALTNNQVKTLKTNISLVLDL